MTQNLYKAGANFAVRESDDISRLPCLQSWLRTNSALIMHFNNGTVQVKKLFII